MPLTVLDMPPLPRNRELALQYLARSLEADPSIARSWYLIGHAYMALQEHSKCGAEDTYEPVAINDPEHATVLRRLGQLYHQDGSSPQNEEITVQYLTRSLEADFSDPQSWFFLGQAYLAVHGCNKDNTKGQFQCVVTDNPGHAKVLLRLGQLYHQDGSSSQNQMLAIQYFTKSLEADPTDVQAWYLLGHAYMTTQNYTKAHEAYQQAMQLAVSAINTQASSDLDPSNPIMSRHLAAPGLQDMHLTAHTSTVAPLFSPGPTGSLNHFVPQSQYLVTGELHQCINDSIYAPMDFTTPDASIEDRRFS